jgi:hypothetical protein
VAVLVGAGATTSWALDLKGLVLYLSFDEGTGKTAKDASGNKNNADLEGKVDWTQGKFGKAITVADDVPGNRVVVKNNDTFKMAKEITLAAWCNIETVPDGHNSIITKADVWMIHTSNWRNQAGKLDWEPLFWTPGFVAWQTKASAVIPMKEWHHIAGVYDGQKVLTYVDGKLAGEIAQPGTLAANTADVVVGRDSRGCCAGRKSKQSIDEVMVWSRALSADEVKAVVDAQVVAVQPQGRAAVLWGAVKAGR